MTVTHRSHSSSRHWKAMRAPGVSIALTPRPLGRLGSTPGTSTGRTAGSAAPTSTAPAPTRGSSGQRHLPGRRGWRQPRHVYWTGFPNSIGRAKLDGSGVDPSFITGAGYFPLGIAVDARHIYWANPPPSAFDDHGVPPDRGSIGRANLNGSTRPLAAACIRTGARRAVAASGVPSCYPCWWPPLSCYPATVIV